MFQKKTVIVIGAGASTEVGISSGRELRYEIAKLLDIRFAFNRQEHGDYLISNALMVAVQGQGGRDINPHLHAARRICDAMPQAISIDNFIDAHSQDKRIELCGKLAIVRSILSAEHGSRLFFAPHEREAQLNYRQLEETWFNDFMQLLTENCPVARLAERLESVSLIIFNYDRCVEHFLFHALQNYYGINAKEAMTLLASLKIYHPYGAVGSLPWQGTTPAKAFGVEPTAHELVALADQIKTFTEQTGPDTSEVSAMRRAIVEAGIVVLLGFAFHKQNMELLTPDEEDYEEVAEISTTRYFATAKGISHGDCELVRGELDDLCNSNTLELNVRNDLSCNQLFREYWRSLSLA